MSPKISVIVPVYNAEKYLEQCLDSIVNQTLRDIEIILVDDGSTDGSAGILDRYARIDRRIILLAQENRGAGAARNAGLAAAQGEYLSFLDSDDWFELTMLEKMYERAAARSADVVWCKTRGFDNVTKMFENMDWMCRCLPQKESFSYRDIKTELGCAFTCAWDKLFRHNFIKENNLLFQELDNMNDSFFAVMSVYRAKNMSLCDEVFVNYRKNVESSLTNNLEKNILSCLKVYDALKNELQKIGVFAEVECLFFNFVLKDTFFRMYLQKRYPAFSTMFYSIKNIVVPMIKFEKHERDYCREDLRPLHDEVRSILSMDISEYLFSKLQEAYEELKCSGAERVNLCNENASIRRELDVVRAEKTDIERGLSFRLGRKITWFPRKIRGALRCLHEYGLKYTVWLFMKKTGRRLGIGVGAG